MSKGFGYKPTPEHSPIEQGKRHILQTCLPLVKEGHKEMIIPCYRRDYEDYAAALKLPEVVKAIEQSGLERVTLQVVDKHGKPLPDIVIATVKDVASGKLDEFMKRNGW